MDNELIINIGDKVLKFKLKSQAIVTLEKTYGKNIFEIFQDLSFTSIQNIFWESLLYIIKHHNLATVKSCFSGLKFGLSYIRK